MRTGLVQPRGPTPGTASSRQPPRAPRRSCTDNPPHHPPGKHWSRRSDARGPRAVRSDLLRYHPDDGRDEEWRRSPPGASSTQEDGARGHPAMRTLREARAPLHPHEPAGNQLSPSKPRMVPAQALLLVPDDRPGSSSVTLRPWESSKSGARGGRSSVCPLLPNLPDPLGARALAQTLQSPCAGRAWPGGAGGKTAHFIKIISLT